MTVLHPDSEPPTAMILSYRQGQIRHPVFCPLPATSMKQEGIVMKISLQSVCNHLFSIKFIVIAGLFWAASSTAAYGADITLAWDDTNDQESIAGYKLYYDNDDATEMYQGIGIQEGDSPITVYLEDLADPTEPQFTVTNLEADQYYYFAVTTFDANGIESDFSEEIGVIIDEEGNVTTDERTQSDSTTDSESGGGGGCLITTAMDGKMAATPAVALGILLLLGLAAAICTGNRNRAADLPE